MFSFFFKLLTANGRHGGHGVSAVKRVMVSSCAGAVALTLLRYVKGTGVLACHLKQGFVTWVSAKTEESCM